MRCRDCEVFHLCTRTGGFPCHHRFLSLVDRLIGWMRDHAPGWLDRHFDEFLVAMLFFCLGMIIPVFLMIAWRL